MEWWQLYGESQLTRQTRENYRYLWDRYVEPTLGGVALADLTPLLLERWKADLLGRDVGPESVRRTLIMLQGVLQRAVEWQYLAANPARVVRKPASTRRHVVHPLSPSIVETMRAYLLARRQPLDALLITTMAYAGLRPGEALGLSWGAVGTRSLVISQAASMGELGPTKTRRARTVRLMRPLAEDLERHRAVVSLSSEALVFSESMAPWTPHRWRNWRRRRFRVAAEVAGLTRVRPYDLRHSYVSLLIAEGRTVLEVARQAGHSPLIALNTYGHVFDERDPDERRSAEQQIWDARREAALLDFSSLQHHKR